MFLSPHCILWGPLEVLLYSAGGLGSATYSICVFQIDANACSYLRYASGHRGGGGDYFHFFSDTIVMKEEM